MCADVATVSRSSLPASAATAADIIAAHSCCRCRRLLRSFCRPAAPAEARAHAPWRAHAGTCRRRGVAQRQAGEDDSSSDTSREHQPVGLTASLPFCCPPRAPGCPPLAVAAARTAEPNPRLRTRQQQGPHSQAPAGQVPRSGQRTALLPPAHSSLCISVSLLTVRSLANPRLSSTTCGQAEPNQSINKSINQTEY